MAEYVFLRYSTENREWDIFAVDIISIDEVASIFINRLKRRKNKFVGCFDIHGILRRTTAIKSGKVDFPVRGYIRLGSTHETIQVHEILQKTGEAVICRNPKTVCKRKLGRNAYLPICCAQECDRFKERKEQFLRDKKSREEEKALRLGLQPGLSSV